MLKFAYINFIQRIHHGASYRICQITSKRHFFCQRCTRCYQELKAGDEVFQNELVYGDTNNPQNAQVIIDVTLTDAKDIMLLGAAELYTDLSAIGGAFEKDEAIVSKDAVESAETKHRNPLT